MARIPTRRDLGNAVIPQAVGGPLASAQDFGGDLGLGQVGRAGAAIAGEFQREEEKRRREAERSEQFQAEIRLQEFLGNSARGLDEAGEQIAPGGDGFTAAQEAAFDAGSEAFVGSLPERLRQPFQARLAARRNTFAAAADNIEDSERTRFNGSLLSGHLENLMIEVQKDPVNSKAFVETGIAAIDASPLPNAAKAEMKRNWRADTAARQEMARVQSDPEYARTYTSPGRARIISDLTSAAKENGLDPAFVLALVDRESGLDPTAKNPNSTARGLGQFLDGTWKAEGGGDRSDPKEQIRVLMKHTAKNKKALEAGLDREVTPAEVYAAHFLGLGGAKRALAHAPGAKMKDIFKGDWAAIKKANGLRDDVTQGEFMQSVARDLARRGEKFGGIIKHGAGNAPGLDAQGHAQAGKVANSLIAAFDKATAKESADALELERDRIAQEAVIANSRGELTYADLDSLEAAGIFTPEQRRAETIKLDADGDSARTEQAERIAAAAEASVKQAQDARESEDRGAQMELSLRADAGENVEAEARAMVDDGRMTPAAGEKIIRKSRTATAKIEQAEQEARLRRDFLQGAVDGTTTPEPFNKEHRDIIDAVWSESETAQAPIFGEDSEQARGEAIAITHATGIAPEGVITAMRGALVRRDPNEMLQAVQLARQLRQVAPGAFAGRDGRKEIDTAVDQFAHFTDRLRYDPEAAIREVIARTDPAKKEDRKALLPKANEFVDEFESADLAGNFGGMFSSADIGASEGQQEAILARYRDRLREEYIRTGDPELAKAAAAGALVSTPESPGGFGVTGVTGSRRVIEFPPENFHKEIDGSHDWMNEQLSKHVGEFSDGEVTDIQIAPHPANREMTASGQAPRYLVTYIEDVDGVPTLQAAPGRFFFDDTSAEIENAVREAEAEQARQKREADFFNRPAPTTESVAGVLDGSAEFNAEREAERERIEKGSAAAKEFADAQARSPEYIEQERARGEALRLEAADDEPVPDQPEPVPPRRSRRKGF